MRIHEITEARREPTKNTVNRRNGMIGAIFAYVGAEPTYVSFTNLPKIGINPGSAYGTPIGIYAYPLFDETIYRQLERNKIPYAGNARYANVLESTVPPERILNVTEYARLDEDMETLLNVGLRYFPGESLTLTDLFRTARLNVMTPKNPSPPAFEAARLWNAARMLAFAVLETRGGKSLEDFFVEYANYPKAYNEESQKGASILWNKILREIGYDMVLDLGAGVIHHNEPTQAVFLHPQAFKLLERFDNRHWEYAKAITVSPKKAVEMWLAGAMAHDSFAGFLTALVNGKSRVVWHTTKAAYQVEDMQHKLTPDVLKQIIEAIATRAGSLSPNDAHRFNFWLERYVFGTPRLFNALTPPLKQIALRTYMVTGRHARNGFGGHTSFEGMDRLFTREEIQAAMNAAMGRAVDAGIR